MSKIRKNILLLLLCFFSLKFSYGKNLDDTQEQTIFRNNIVAWVNKEPITKYDLDLRKKVLLIINGNDMEASAEELENFALEQLIDTLILEQKFAKQDIDIDEQEIMEDIKKLETTNQLSIGYFFNILENNKEYIRDFKKQIKLKLLKDMFISNLSSSIQVPKKDIEQVVIDQNYKDTYVSALVFSTDDKSKLKQMQNLSKKLKSCDKVKESDYSSFASIEKIDQNASSLDNKMQEVVKNLKENHPSGVMIIDNSLKVVLLCEKQFIDFNQEESEQVRSMLMNKKLSKKISSSLELLKRQANIKINK